MSKVEIFTYALSCEICLKTKTQHALEGWEGRMINRLPGKKYRQVKTTRFKTSLTPPHMVILLKFLSKLQPPFVIHPYIPSPSPIIHIYPPGPQKKKKIYKTWEKVFRTFRPVPAIFRKLLLRDVPEMHQKAIHKRSAGKRKIDKQKRGGLSCHRWQYGHRSPLSEIWVLFFIYIVISFFFPSGSLWEGGIFFGRGGHR